MATQTCRAASVVVVVVVVALRMTVVQERCFQLGSLCARSAVSCVEMLAGRDATWVLERRLSRWHGMAQGNSACLRWEKKRRQQRRFGVVGCKQQVEAGDGRAHKVSSIASRASSLSDALGRVLLEADRAAACWLWSVESGVASVFLAITASGSAWMVGERDGGSACMHASS